jgi:hypothetical protein
MNVPVQVEFGRVDEKPHVACSVRVSTSVFERIWQIVSKRKSRKLFGFNTRQGFESHPLRHSTHLRFAFDAGTLAHDRPPAQGK